MVTLLGIKRGMSQLWLEDGTRVPFTVIDVEPNVVTAVKTEERDGYAALQLGIGAIRPAVMAKAQRVDAERKGVPGKRHLREVRGETGAHKVGDTLPVDLFAVGQLVDVIGTSKGKGFAGTVKLHGFARGPTSHGSQNVRRPGSIGMKEHPGRVLKGKRMAARMGNERVTAKALEVLAVDVEKGHLLVKGPIPGNAGGLVVIRHATSIGERTQANMKKKA